MRNLVIAALLSGFLLYFYAFVWLFFLKNNKSEKRKKYYYFLVQKWKNLNNKNDMPVFIVLRLVYKAVFDMRI